MVKNIYDSVGNSEKSLVDSGVNEKSEWTKIIQPNDPFFDEYEKYDKLCSIQFSDFSLANGKSPF